eukprot:COSAG01_NODE_3138_length_6526_cov_478.100202_2_plen_500_part_00
MAPCAAQQTTAGTPPLSSGAAQLCSINSLFTRLTAIKADTHCRAGCQGGQCPPDWYPGVGDTCNAECGAVFEPFWDECGAILVTSGMGGMSEMASFYDSCLHALYPPGSCGTFCNAHTYACYLAEVQASCCDEDGTNCVAGRDVPLACPVGCALVFPEFLETCRAHVNATFSLDILDFEAFEQSCLTQDGLQLVDYAMSLIAAGCTLDLSAHSSTDGHRRLQGHTSDGFLQRYVGSSSPGCHWDDIDDMATNIDAICGGLTSTCSAQCAIATRQFTTTCGPTLAIILPAGDPRMSSISAFETSCIQQADPAQFLHAMMAATCLANATNATTHGPSVSIASCYDGIQNQREIGVDCGGICLPCAPAYAWVHKGLDGSPGISTNVADMSCEPTTVVNEMRCCSDTQLSTAYTSQTLPIQCSSVYASSAVWQPAVHAILQPAGTPNNVLVGTLGTVSYDAALRACGNVARRTGHLQPQWCTPVHQGRARPHVHARHRLRPRY